MVLTGEEIHHGGIRPVAGTTKVTIVVQGAHSNDEMKDRIKGEWAALDELTRETMQALAARKPDVDGQGAHPGQHRTARSGRRTTVRPGPSTTVRHGSAPTRLAADSWSVWASWTRR